jgi:hypothetical protein
MPAGSMSPIPASAASAAAEGRRLATLTEAHCLAWDPLAGAEEPIRHGTVMDGREERLAGLLAQAFRSLPEVAVSREDAAGVGDEPAGVGAEAGEAGMGEDETSGEEGPGDTRLTYLAALSRPAEARALVLTSSPWAAESLAVALYHGFADLRPHIRLWLPGEPEPTDGSLVIAACGQTARGAYSDTVLYHPPYRRTGYPGERLHLLWLESEWLLTETALGWPYPDRDVLVNLYKILRAGDATPERLAEALGEMPGPWNRLRWLSGLAIFAEIGITDANGNLLPSTRGAKFQLEASGRYRNGQTVRSLLAERGSVPQ